MKAAALLAGLSLTALATLACARSTTPTEPSRAGSVRVITAYQPSCTPPSSAFVFVFIDTVGVGSVPLPGEARFDVAPGPHKIAVGSTPPGAFRTDVTVEPGSEATAQWVFSCAIVP